MRTYLAFGLAIGLCLFLLWRVGPAGELELVGGLLAMLLAAVLPSRDGRRRPSRWRHVPPGVAGAAALVGFASLLGGDRAAEELAWFARAVALVSAATLLRTPAQALALHGLTVVLALWTAGALQGALNPESGLVTIGILTLSAHAVVGARARELRSTADASLTTGVAPTPRGIRRPLLPVLLLVVLAMLPSALGWSIPRPTRGIASADPAAAPLGASPTAKRRPAVRRVAFSGELRVDRGHEGLVEPTTRVAEVVAHPAPPLLYLRGATLPRATAEGFLPGPSPEVPIDVAFRSARLEVTLLSPQADHLFALGEVAALEGVDWTQTPAGLRVAGRPEYPLSYRARCLLPDSSVGPASLSLPDDPRLLDLPPEVLTDPDLRGLASSLGAQGGPLERAGAVMRHLGSEARYDGDHAVPPGDLHTTVRRFLLDDRRGICVEFAAAAAVLLRLQGVPCRVVTGFRTHEREEDRFVVRARHAHAWVEVAVEGAGWIPYDPSPAGESSAAAAEDPASPGPVARPSGGSGPDPLGRWTPVLPLLLTLGALASWLLTRRRARVLALGTRLGAGPPPTRALRSDRERLFERLEERGFDPLSGSTPLEWLSAREVWLDEPALREAVEHYTFLRFSGRRPAERVVSFRRSLRALERRRAATGGSLPPRPL